MNVYLTTVYLNDPERSVRKKILNASIASLLAYQSDPSKNFILSGIITPSWKNPLNLDSYKGVKVLSVTTRQGCPDPNLGPRDPKYFQYPCLNKNVRKHGKRHWAKTDIQKRNTEDNEHQALLENMQLNYPCLVSDGDIIYDNKDFSILIKLLKKRDKSQVLLPKSHLLYLHKEEDRHHILINPIETFDKLDLIYYKTMHCRRGIIDFAAKFL